MGQSPNKISGNTNDTLIYLTQTNYSPMLRLCVRARLLNVKNIIYYKNMPFE